MAVTVNDLYDRLKHLFSDGAENLDTLEKTVAATAFTAALSIIQTEFLSRGGTLAQVDLWLRLDEFQMDMATFATLMNLGKDRDDNEKHAAWAKVFDRRKEFVNMKIALSDGTILDTAKEEAADDRPVSIINLKTINDDLGI